MVEVVWAAGLVVLFVGLLRRLKLAEGSREVMGLTRASLGVMGDPSLGDDAKEARLRANTLRLFRHFVVLASGGAVALIVPFAVLWLGDATGWVSLEGVLAASVSPLFLVAAGAVALIVLVLPRS